MNIFDSLKTVKSQQGGKVKDTYELIKEIGSGAFGKVWIAVRHRDGKKIALKVVSVPWHDTKIRTLIDNEIQTLIDLTKPECINPFVVCYYNSFYDEITEEYKIEMEYIDGKDMFDFVLDESVPATQMYRYLVLIAKDIAEGLRYVHSKGIVHNDIKLENVMIQKDTNIPKIIDFGLSCMSPCNMDSGTKEYIAPESTSGYKTTASDMWALGISLYAGATKKFPFAGKDTNMVFKQIINKPVPQLITSNTLLNDIVNSLLVKDPNKRLSSDQIIEMVNGRLTGPPPSPTPATLGYGDSRGSSRTPQIPPTTTQYLNDSMELTPARPKPMRPVRPVRPMRPISFGSSSSESSSSGSGDLLTISSGNSQSDERLIKITSSLFEVV